MPSRPRTDEFSELASLFGAKIRAAREAKSWSHLKLSEVSGLSYRGVQLIEANTNNERSARTPQPANPKLDTVYALAAALELDVAYLVDPSRGVETDAVRS